MKLLPNEEKLLTSNGEKIVLTNYRIQMDDSILGQSYSISIFLENISSIEIKYKNNILFLILGALSAIGGFAGGSPELGLIVGGIFIAIWWFTRKHVVSISSDGGSSLDFQVSGMKMEQIYDFRYNVELAKQERIQAKH